MHPDEITRLRDRVAALANQAEQVGRRADEGARMRARTLAEAEREIAAAKQRDPPRPVK